jgi:MoxR-like ATPase
MKFEGTESYVTTRDLTLAVNAAVVLQRPLLIKGEPGTGKTLLAEEVARALNMPLFQWHIKSTTKAQQGLYEYDAVSRLRDSQLGDPRVEDISHYIVHGVLWQAFECEQQSVVLIDEIDKADIEFPNDLLRELDRMEFHCYELQRTIKAKHRPLIIITSNNEKELPDAFLRRCFFHYIKFPDKETMTRIVDVHFPTLKRDLLREALEVFFRTARSPRSQEKAVHQRADRLAQAAAGRRHSARSPARQGSQRRHSAAAWRAAQERTGRPSLRAPCLHGPA